MNDLFNTTKISTDEFDKYLKALSPLTVPIEQTPLWGEFDNSIAGRHFLGSFVVNDHSGKMVAIFSATLYKNGSRSWIWLKHGPLFASVPSKKIVENFCLSLKKQFQEVESVKPLFIRLGLPQKVTMVNLPFEHTMYDETVEVDLLKTEEEILADMSQSGRQGIRRAAKNAVEIKEIKKDKSKFFSKNCYKILTETAKRGRFGVHKESLYLNMLDSLGENVKLFCAYYQNEVVAWAITTEYMNKSMYYYGGSNETARNLYAPYLLHFEIIKDMKQRGNKIYDFMGIAGKNYPSLANVTQFKLKFSKNVVKVTQTYDLPLNKLRYAVVTSLIKIKRKVK